MRFFTIELFIAIASWQMVYKNVVRPILAPSIHTDADKRNIKNWANVRTSLPVQAKR